VVENILKNFVPLSDRRELRAMRITLVVFAICVLAYSIRMEGTPIYELVAMAYQFPVVGAFWPLVLGLYWDRSTTQGAVWSIVLGMSTWALLSLTPLGEVIPSVLAGLIMAGIGMVVGSLAPTAGNRAHREHRARHQHTHHAGARLHG
jgi:Na+/proline symporter